MIKRCNNCLHSGNCPYIFECKDYSLWKLKTIQNMYPNIHKILYTDTDSIKVDDDPDVKCIFNKDQLISLFQWLFNIKADESEYLVDVVYSFVKVCKEEEEQK